MRALVTLVAFFLTAAPCAAADLMDIYRQALRADPELRSSQAAANAAEARYRQARGQLLPNLSANASYSKVQQKQSFQGAPAGGIGGGDEDDDDFHDQQSIDLTLNQVLFDWSAWQSKDAAAVRRAAADAELEVAEQALMVRVAQRYFDVLATHDALQAARERRETIDRQLARAAAAYQSGLSPITDQQEAQSEFDAARVEVIDARNRLNRARDALRQLIGEAPGALAGLRSPSSPQAPEADVATWTERAIGASPAVAAARQAYRATDEEVSAAHGGHLPVVSLVGRIGESEQTVNFPVPGAGTTEFDSVTETRSIGLELSLPIFAGGATSAAVDEAHYLREQARQDLIAAQRQVTVDVHTAYQDVEAAVARIAALDAAIHSGETAVKAAEAGLQTGTRNILDVLEAQTDLVQRRVDRRQAWYDYELARLRLRQAAGVLSQSELAALNRRLSPAQAVPGPGEGENR